MQNISASGLSIGFVYPTGDVEHNFKVGDEVEISTDGFDAKRGKIVRSTDRGVAIKFDVDVHEEKILIAEIMALQNEIPIV